MESFFWETDRWNNKKDEKILARGNTYGQMNNHDDGERDYEGLPPPPPIINPRFLRPLLSLRIRRERIVAEALALSQKKVRTRPGKN